MGLTGPMGPTGATGPAGPAGPAGSGLGLGDAALLFVLAERRERNHALAVRLEIERIVLERKIAALPRCAGGVGKNHDRCLKPLGTMHRHHTDLTAAAVGIPLEIARPGIEPRDETGEARGRSRCIGTCGVQQFVDRVARPDDLGVAARNLEQLAARIPSFLPWPLRVLIAIGGPLARIAPWPIVPIARRVQFLPVQSNQD